MDLKEYFRRNRTFVTFALLTAFSVLSLISGPNATPAEVGMSVLGIVQRTTGSVGNFVTATRERFRSSRELREENIALRERVEELELAQKDLRALEIEAEQLREVLGYSDIVTYHHISARVIGRDPENVLSTITINRGRRDGLERNMPVIAVQDGRQSLVGRLIEVGQGTSKVLPIHDGNAHVAAHHQESRFQGLVSGAGSAAGEVIMNHISRDAEGLISEGDAIHTSGMRSLYPSDIPIGTVIGVSSAEFETDFEVRIEPHVDMDRLEYVYVLIQGGS